MATHSTPESEHDEWRERRRAAVVAPTGNLSLVETRWFATGTRAEEAAERVATERQQAGPGLTVTELHRNNINTGEPEHGLRVWNANAPAIHAFETIETFPFAPEWVLEAQYAAAPEGRTIAFEHIRDAGGTRELVVPGDITFSHNGETFTLAAFDDAGELLLVFGDQTNGRDDETGTYGAGRFLFVQRTDDNRVILDFNRAFVPPCGFSAQYNCPMPPASNRLPWGVHAGERHPRFRDGFDIYTTPVHEEHAQ